MSANVGLVPARLTGPDIGQLRISSVLCAKVLILAFGHWAPLGSLLGSLLRVERRRVIARDL